MSFLKSLFGSKTSKKLKRTYDKSGLRRIYEEAKELFLRGKYDPAIDSFTSIYEHDVTFRDVASIIDDYYVMPKDKWIAKYKAQFRAQLPKASRDDAGPKTPRKPLLNQNSSITSVFGDHFLLILQGGGVFLWRQETAQRVRAFYTKRPVPFL